MEISKRLNGSEGNYWSCIGKICLNCFSGILYLALTNKIPLNLTDRRMKNVPVTYNLWMSLFLSYPIVHFYFSHICRQRCLASLPVSSVLKSLTLEIASREIGYEKLRKNAAWENRLHKWEKWISVSLVYFLTSVEGRERKRLLVYCGLYPSIYLYLSLSLTLFLSRSVCVK